MLYIVLYTRETEVGSGKISFHLVFGEGGKGNKLGEVGGEELGHAEGADAVVAEHLQGRG